MRDHKKIKAIRSKFGIAGYGIWVMTLEYLTGNDGNVFQYSDLEFELMSGDFGVSATEIRAVIDYCISLELLFNDKGFVKSESLDERLSPVYEKRGLAKELSKKQLRINGKYVSSNTVDPVVSATEMPQSKVNKSKVNKSKSSYQIPYPEGDLKNAWLEWEQYRKEKKQKLTPSTAKKQIQFLGARADSEAIAIINQSITNGWTGLFELKNNYNNGNRSATTGISATISAQIGGTNYDNQQL